MKQIMYPPGIDRRFFNRAKKEVKKQLFFCNILYRLVLALLAEVVSIIYCQNKWY